MQTAQYYLDLAKHSELRGLKSKDDTDAFLSYLNLALVEIYKTFNLKTKEQIIDLYDNIPDYTLNNDVLDVQLVFDENGKEMTINDENDSSGVFLSAIGTITVPRPYTGGQISVIYQASPVTLTSMSDTVPLTDAFSEAILMYIGYRAHAALKTAVDQVDQSNAYYLRFVKSLDKIESLGLVPVDHGPLPKVEDKGFV